MDAIERQRCKGRGGTPPDGRRSRKPVWRAGTLYGQTSLLIHGTNSPKTIGHLVSSGCIRLVNDDVEDLYRRVSLEARVIFVS